MKKGIAIKPTPCELYGYRYLRGIRLLIAAELVKKHGLPQLKAARLVGIPQPLLNAYLHGKRRPLSVREIERINDIKELVRIAAKEIISGVTVSACSLCKAILALKGIKCPETAKEIANACS